LAGCAAAISIEVSAHASKMNPVWNIAFMTIPPDSHLTEQGIAQPILPRCHAEG
jgi:hypothetical protein